MLLYENENRAFKSEAFDKKYADNPDLYGLHTLKPVITYLDVLASELTPLGSSFSCLDLGSSQGQIIGYCMELFDNHPSIGPLKKYFVGVEASRVAVHQANETFGEGYWCVDTVQEFLAHYPIYTAMPQQFDLVINRGGFMWCESEKEYLESLKSIYGFLKPGGSYIYIVGRKNFNTWTGNFCQNWQKSAFEHAQSVFDAAEQYDHRSKYMYRYIREPEAMSEQAPKKSRYRNIVQILSPLPRERVGLPLSITWTSLQNLPEDAEPKIYLWDADDKDKKPEVFGVKKQNPLFIEDVLKPGNYLLQLRFVSNDAIWPSRKIPLTLSDDAPTEQELMHGGTGERIYCAAPWIKMNIGKFNANPCCNLKRQVRIPYNADVEDFDPWNSESMMELRKALLRGDDRYCHPNCKYLEMNLEDARKNYNYVMPQKIKALQSFYNGDYFIQSSPVYIKMTLNHYCNHACVFCSRDTRSSWRAGKGMWSLLKKYRHGLSTVSFSGGEPLLFIEDISDKLIKIANDIEMIHFDIQTNGSLLLKCADFLTKLGSLSLNVSFNAGTPEGYQKVHRRDHFDQVIKGIKKIQELRQGKETHILLKMVTMKSNYEQIPDFARVAADLKVDDVKFTNVLLYKNSDIDESEIFHITDPEWIKAETLILEAKEFLYRKGIGLYYSKPGDQRDDLQDEEVFFQEETTDSCLTDTDNEK
jgi:MoaA/NifB/PqqE/SkfB family radical SAM enzyme